MVPAQFETLSYDIDANGQTFKAKRFPYPFLKDILRSMTPKTEDDDQKDAPKAKKGRCWVP